MQADWVEAVDLAEELVEALGQEAAALDSTLAVVSVPAPEQVYPERWQRIMQRYPPMQPSRASERVAQQAGVPFLDLLPVFRAAAESTEPLHLRVDGHWTLSGERLAWEAAAEFLRSTGLADTER